VHTLLLLSFEFERYQCDLKEDNNIEIHTYCRSEKQKLPTTTMGTLTRIICTLLLLGLIYWYIRSSADDEEASIEEQQPNNNNNNNLNQAKQFLIPGGVGTMQKSPKGTLRPTSYNELNDDNDNDEWMGEDRRPNIMDEKNTNNNNKKPYVTNTNKDDYALDEDEGDLSSFDSIFTNNKDEQQETASYSYDDEDNEDDTKSNAVKIFEDYSNDEDGKIKEQEEIKPTTNNEQDTTPITNNKEDQTTSSPSTTTTATTKSPSKKPKSSAPTLPESEDADDYEEEGDAAVKETLTDKTPFTQDDEETLKDLESKEQNKNTENYDDDVLRECKLKRSKHPGVYLGPRIQYIHIPKAGGTSIQEALRIWAAESDGRAWSGTFDGPSTDGSSTKCPPRALDFTTLMGHRGFGFCKDVEESPRGLFTFTAVREPVSRIVSMFDYKTETRNNPNVRKVFGVGSNNKKKNNNNNKANNNESEKSLNDLIKFYNATPEIEPGEARLRFGGSQQARFLCGYQCLGPSAEKGKYSEKELLNRARKNLQKIDALTVVDRLDELIPQLKLHLTFVPPRFTKWPSMNVASVSKTKKSMLDDQSKEILRNWAWVDNIIYKEADKLSRIMHERAVACLKLIRGKD
jgi:hypothetical protein